MTVTSKKINETGVGGWLGPLIVTHIFFVGINDTKRVWQHPTSSHHIITNIDQRNLKLSKSY